MYSFFVSARTLCVTTTGAYTDIYRMLAQSQDDNSITNIFGGALPFCGPFEAADMLLKQEIIPLGISDAIEDIPSSALLPMALRSYAAVAVRGQAAEMEKWETLMRKLIRTGSDLHAPYSTASQQSCYGTHLDELFMLTCTPAEAKIAADGWLGFLSSEGIDVVAYLEKEMNLRARQNGIMLPNRILEEYDVNQQLVFVFDDGEPSVYWDWWVDPTSSTYLLRREFKQVVMISMPDVLPFFDDWEDTWPFTYPEWYASNANLYGEEDFARWRRLDEVAQQRANRRLQKARVKAARLQGLKYPNMPGAWQG